MVFFDSSEEVTNTGNNAVQVSNAITLAHEDLSYCIYIITGIKIIELGLAVYRTVLHRLKKKYTAGNI